MTDDSLTAALDARQAVVVHFSHRANMRQGGVFPEDLQEAIKNKDSWALSCSVVWAGHRTTPCGSVGVMFKPSMESVLSVSNVDSGSSAGPSGADFSAGVPLTDDSFQLTFDVVGDYNEWRVRGADVVGIFVHDVNFIETKRECTILGMPDGEILREITFAPIPLSDVFAAFPGLLVFTMTDCGLVEVINPTGV